MATIRNSIQLSDGVTVPLRSMGNAMNIIIASFESMQRASSHAVDTASIQAARTELVRAQASFNQVEQEIIQAGQAQQRFNNDIRSGQGAADGLMGKIKGIVIAVGGIMGVKKILDISDTITSNTARLNLMNDKMQTTSQLNDMIFESSQRARGSYLETAATVSKLGILAGKAFSGNKEMINFVELMNKNFVIGGQDIMTQTAAMRQLTQAMASGRLQGDELVSIREGAPMLAVAIEDYMKNVMGLKGSMKDFSSEGLITATVIKNALFSVAEETNKMFKTMPITFAQVWQGVSDRTLRVFEPILIKLNEIANSKKFEAFSNGIVNGLRVIAGYSITAFDGLISAAKFVGDNWSTIQPILFGVAGALAAYVIPMIWKTIAALYLQLGVLYANVMAWLALNLPILLIGAAIALLIYAMINFGDVVTKVVGYIGGVFGVLVGYLYNQFAFLANYFLSVAEFFANVFIDPVYAVKKLFYDMSINVLSFIANIAKGIENLLNKIPGININITSNMDNLLKNLEANRDSLKSKEDVVKFARFEQVDYSTAFSMGQDMGEKFGGKAVSAVQGLADKLDFSKLMGGADNTKFDMGNPNLGNDMANTAANTAAMKDSMNTSEEDLQYLRDLTEQTVINHFTNEIKVDMTNHNNINSEIDIDGVVSHLEEKLYETMQVAAEGVHK